MNQREEAYKRKLERETERRRRAEEIVHQIRQHEDELDVGGGGGAGVIGVGGVGATRATGVQHPPGTRVLMLGGPDYEVRTTHEREVYLVKRWGRGSLVSPNYRLSCS